MEHVYNYETFTGKNLTADELATVGEISSEEVTIEEVTPDALEDDVEGEVTEIPMDTSEKKRFIQKFIDFDDREENH